MPTATIITSIARPPLSPNSRDHWRSRHRITRETRHQIAWRTRNAGVPTGLPHATVTVHYRPADKRGLWDLDNLTAGCKPIWDALTARGTGHQHPVVADDTPEHMVQRVEQHQPVKGKPGAVWLVIEWADAQEAVPC